MKNFRGISLVELLLGITVASIAGMLVVNLLTSSYGIFYNQSVNVSQGLSLNQASQEITDLIKSSSGVAEKYPVSGTPQYISGANILVLKLPALSPNGSVIDAVFDYVVVGPDASNPRILRQQIFKNAASVRNEENKVLTTALDSLTFNYLDSSNGSVSPLQAARVNFTINLGESVGTGDNESSASGIVNLKNI